MNRKVLLILTGLFVAAAFLLGFVPQYRKSKDLETQIGAARQELNPEREKRQRAELALLIGYAYLQANQKNYGLASQNSTTFFDRAHAMAGQASDTSWQAFLQSALAKRDAVIGGLAKGDPAIVPTLQELFQGALEATQTGRQ